MREAHPVCVCKQLTYANWTAVPCPILHVLLIYDTWSLLFLGGMCSLLAEEWIPGDFTRWWKSAYVIYRVQNDGQCLSQISWFRKSYICESFCKIGSLNLLYNSWTKWPLIKRECFRRKFKFSILSGYPFREYFFYQEVLRNMYFLLSWQHSSLFY